jgi:hypothetical protein
MTTAATTPAAAIDLRPFCNPHPSDRFRAAGEPHTLAGFTYATDGRILVRVPATVDDTLSLLPGEMIYRTIDGRGFPPAWTLPLPAPAEIADSSQWQPWPAIDYTMEDRQCGACGGDGSERGEDCAECDGDGEVRCPTCDHLTECDRCDGRGYLRGKQCPFCSGCPKGGPFPTTQRVGDMAVELRIDAKVRVLPNVRWRKAARAGAAVSDNGGELVQFVFDGGCGLLVPMMRETK